MAQGKPTTPGGARPGLGGAWFWLAGSFAATLFLVAGEKARDRALDALLDEPTAAAVAIVAWALAGRLLGAILSAAGRGRAPAWTFTMSGWSVATLAAGVLLALAAAGDPATIRQPDRLAESLLAVGALGFAWWLVIDLGRVVLWRLSEREAPPFLSVGTLAFLGGLAGIAAALHRHVMEGPQAEPLQAGLALVGIALAAGALLTVAVELPRALLPRLRAARGSAAAPGHDRHRAATEGSGRERLVATIRDRAGGDAAAAGPPMRMPQGRASHALTQPPPTVVRR